MTTLTDRDDAAHLAADLAMVRRAALANEPRDYEAGLRADAFGDRPVPAEVRLAYLAGELEGALRERDAYEQALRGAVPNYGTPPLMSGRVWLYLSNTRGEHFRARVRRAGDALDAALARMEGDGTNG